MVTVVVVVGGDDCGNIDDDSRVGVGGRVDGHRGDWNGDGGDRLVARVAVDMSVAVVLVVVVVMEDTAIAVVAEVLVTQTLGKGEKQKT